MAGIAPLDQRPVTERLPGALTAYRVALTLLSPLASAWLGRRARRGKEDPERLRERYGYAARERPAGGLVWAHGASIGETVTLIPIVEALVARGLSVLVTSGTTTSAEILSRRLPAGAFHQYLPLDAPHFVRRFLDHWQPHLALFAESELWPTTILELARREIPLVLVNARLSPRSFARWQRVPQIAAALMSRFALCVAQTEADAARLAQAGAPLCEISGNLKYDIAPLPADPRAVETLSGQLAGRPVWLAASTHPGEDEIVIEAHLANKARHPGLVTLIVPRHPARGRDIADLARLMGLSANRRSLGDRVDQAGDIHVVDTVGELGLFYRVAPLAFVGGSLVAHGGQNPIEPARLGTAILHGPHVANFDAVYAAFDRDGGALPVQDMDALAAAVGDLLDDPGLLRDMARAAGGTVAAHAGALDRTMRAIEPYLPGPDDPAGTTR